METLIIEVDCKSSNKNPPQLGITVEAPLSQQRALHQRKQQAALSAAKDYSNHGYQNLNNLLDNNNSHRHNSNPSPQSEHDHKSRINSDSKNVTSSHKDQSHSSPLSKYNGFERPIKDGLQITQIQEGSVIDRNGKFRIGDIIIEVNNTSLQLPFADAQKTLKEFVVSQSSHGPLRLKVLRRFASSSSLPSTNGSQSTVIERNGSVSDNKTSPTCMIQQPNMKRNQLLNDILEDANHSSRHLGGPLNTRKIGTKHRIILAKAKDGFGIKIAERDNMFGVKRPIYITAITTSGSAYKDGRLKEGDMLLEINGIDLSSKTQPEVAKMLKNVQVDEKVEFIVSRHVPLQDYYSGNAHVDGGQNHKSCDNDTSLIDLNDETYPDTQTINIQFEKKVDSILNVPTIDGPGTYVYDIPLNDTKSAGLGLYLKYPNLNGEDLGIWIEKVITGGAAWKDGRLQPNDQILSINGINLVRLSNAQASETLTAAVCRGIGPQATSSTIRLNIRRRDPSVVAKILHGTNNRIEHSDQRDNIHDPPFISTGKPGGYSVAQNLKQSRNRPLSDNNSSNSSSSNSQNDSGLSPQTQASNSLKLSASYNDRSEQSDKTNDNSSAISQITDFTTVQTAENESKDQPSSEPVATRPKYLHNDINHLSEPTPSIQSWDDESTDDMTGEERFQRDGFGRQSISEKRHAQLLANTDTFRKNQKIREERKRQRELEEKLERQQLNDDVKRSQTPTPNRHFTSNNMAMASTRSIPSGRNQWSTNNSVQNHHSIATQFREAQVDIPRRHEVEVEFPPPIARAGNITGARYEYAGNVSNRNSHPQITMLDYQGIPHQMNQIQACWVCRSSHCICPNSFVNQVPHDPSVHPDFMERSIQQLQVREHIPPITAGTVRVSRGRKINESFRAAVDRSYENSFNNSSQLESISSDRRSASNIKSGNSTTSTANDEKHLLSNGDGPVNTNSKKSSLLTRFLRFGTDAFRKSQKLRGDRKRQRELEDKSERQQLNDDFKRSQTQTLNRHFTSNSSTMASTRSIPSGRNQWATNNSLHNHNLVTTQFREAPVDIPRRHEVEVGFHPQVARTNNIPGARYGYAVDVFNRNSHPQITMLDYQGIPHQMNQIQACWVCRSSHCICPNTFVNQVPHDPSVHPDFMKRCIQQLQVREHIHPTAAETINVSRGRKINESFRAAVDRSYENSFNNPSQLESIYSDRDCRF